MKWLSVTTGVHKQICTECADVSKAVIAIAIEFPIADPFITQHVFLCKYHFTLLIIKLKAMADEL